MSRMPGRIPSPERRTGGFTLLEVLLALLLVTTGFLALSQAFSTGLFSSAGDENILISTHLAQEKMEEIRNQSYSSIANETRTSVSGFSGFEREVLVTTPLTNLKQVNVNVYWFSKGDELSTGLVSYVSNN